MKGVASVTISIMNEFAAGWATLVWKASWQGGAALLLVLLLGLVVRRLSAQVRCWLWRLAFLKLLIAGVWTIPLTLPWLPALEKVDLPAPQIGNIVRPLPVPESFPAGTPIAEPVVLTAGPTIINHTPQVVTPRLSGWSWLLIIWSCGVLVSLVSLIRQWLSVRKMVQTLARVANEEVRACLVEACRQFRICKHPEIRISDTNGTPCLIGIHRPIIVLPTAVLTGNAEALAAALAHELAHIKRRDLFWNWLPALAEVLFVFHPLVWLAKREWRLTQEIATDELAVTVSRIDPTRYIVSLMELVAQCRPNPIRPHLAVGVSETYLQLSRRINAMQTFHEYPRRRRLIALAAIAVIGAVGLVPWELTAREAPARPEFPATVALPMPKTRVVDAIEKMGGDVVYDERRPGRPVISVSLFKSRARDADLADLKLLVELQALTLDASKISDLGLIHLKGMTTLQALDLNETDVTDKGLRELAGLTKLEQLGLIGTHITDEGLVHLKDMSQMHMLLLSKTKISDKGLVHLSGFSKLGTLSIDGTQVSDAGLENLKAMTQLRDLRLNDTRISNAGLTHLKELTKLQTLVLNSTKVSDEGLVHLGKLSSLQTLWLVDTKITDKGLMHLGGLSKLRALNLDRNTRVSEDGVQRLRAALPDCKIEWTQTDAQTPSNPTTARDHAEEHIIQPAPDPRLLQLPLAKQICEERPPIWAIQLNGDRSVTAGNSLRPLALDNQRILWGSEILDLKTGAKQREFSFGKDELWRAPLCLNHDRRFLLVSCGRRRTNNWDFDLTSWYQVWDVASQKALATQVSPNELGSWSYLSRVDIAGDGSVVASANEHEREVSVWDVATGKKLKTMPVNLDRFAKGYEGRPPFFAPEFLRFSPDGQWLVVFTANRGLYWKWQTAEEPTVIELSRRLESFAFSPDSRYLAEGPGPRENIEIRDMETLQVISRVDDGGAKNSMITSGLTFTADGATLIACNSILVNENKLKIPRRLHFWEVATGKLLRQFSMPLYHPRYLDLSPDGRYLVVYLEGRNQGVLAAWDLNEMPGATR